MADYLYRNVIEVLVEQEVERQLKKLPPKIAQFLRPVELLTYALNRLPILYACSEKGFQVQLKRAKQEYGPQVTKAVQQALAAIQRDPIRKFMPLKPPEQQVLLDEIRELLQDPAIDWANLPEAIERALQGLEDDINDRPELDTDELAQEAWQDYRRKNIARPSSENDGWTNRWSSR